MKRFSVLVFAAILMIGFSRKEVESLHHTNADADYLHRSVKQVTDVIVYDIYSPPVASRIYAYITIAGYEAARHSDSRYQTFAGQVRHLKPLPAPDSRKKYNFSLAAAHAVLTVGKSLIISEDKIRGFHEKMLLEFKSGGTPAEELKNSLAYGQLVADHILAWAAQDNYKQTRSSPKYAINESMASWKPTPPAYMKAVEPHWNRIRTFVLDSAQQFRPLPPTAFSNDKSSQFYKEAQEVYETGLKLSDEQKEIANFWDCNPFKMNINGHVMFATRKISPVGHWVNITRLACKKKNAGLMESAAAYACLSITLADCFISCWDEKYRSNTIRPETYINRYISEDWVPLLQTPPFPEYTSGHSVVSTASAVVLTKMFGDNFSFADSTELEFGIPVRQFKSFNQAAREAAISRMYGGIHYMPAIRNGMVEGRDIGEFIAGRLKMRK
ncbi:MAG: vanadium-dependent haloperoxidase [Chitinophagaceae bacterium]